MAKDSELDVPELIPVEDIYKDIEVSNDTTRIDLTELEGELDLEKEFERLVEKNKDKTVGDFIDTLDDLKGKCTCGAKVAGTPGHSQWCDSLR